MSKKLNVGKVRLEAFRYDGIYEAKLTWWRWVLVSSHGFSVRLGPVAFAFGVRR